jgi:hypothetical protein
MTRCRTLRRGILISHQHSTRGFVLYAILGSRRRCVDQVGTCVRDHGQFPKREQRISRNQSLPAHVPLNPPQAARMLRTVRITASARVVGESSGHNLPESCDAITPSNHRDLLSGLAATDLAMAFVVVVSASFHVTFGIGISDQSPQRHYASLPWQRSPYSAQTRD